jgi:hypothetical protein
MRNLVLTVAAFAVMVFLSIASVSAQDGKKMKDGMKMDAMQSSHHHSMMMAYKQASLTFAKALLEMAKDGKLEDVEMARRSFAEIKRSMELSDQVHQEHMSKMDAEMRETMKPMMEKMQAEKAAVKENMLALENSLQRAAPDAIEIERLARELVMNLDMKNKDGMKKELMNKMNK